MIEKALLIAAIAIAALIAISSVGSGISKMMNRTECAWSGKTVCIPEEPKSEKPEGEHRSAFYTVG